MNQQSENKTTGNAFHTIQDCINAINAAERIIITAHPKPDGDAIGSSLSLKYALEKTGKQIVAAGLEPVPNRYKSFVKPDDIKSVAEAIAIKPELIIALDAGSIDRIPEELRELKGTIKILNIDHHISNIGFGDINLLDIDACSTGEIIYQLLITGKYDIDKEIATLLWMAILTDTGRFAYSNTTPRAMHAAAELLCHGIDTEEIDRKIYRQLTRAELNIRETAIHNLQFKHNGRIGFVTLSTKDFDAAGCTTSDTEDIIEIPRCIDGVDVAILFYEDKEKPGKINVSMRSNGSCNVSELCSSFGGGGHTKAAGCRIKDNLNHVMEMILQETTLKLR